MTDTWERGEAYEQYMGRWSRQLAPKFLSWMNCAAGLSWLDIGCGTGALCSAIVTGCSPCRVAGVEPARGFLRAAHRTLADRVLLMQGTAAAIPLEASSVDVVVSSLALNFVPDPQAALREMSRVTTSGGSIGACVWDYAGKMEFIRRFWDAAAQLDPGDARLDEGTRFPICKPEALRDLFASVGLREIEVEAIDLQTNFANFDDYWQPFLGGQGSAPTYLMSLNSPQRARLRDSLRDNLPINADGSIALIARAWAVKSLVAK